MNGQSLIEVYNWFLSLIKQGTSLGFSIVKQSYYALPKLLYGQAAQLQ